MNELLEKVRTMLKAAPYRAYVPVRAYVAGEIKRREEDPVALTVNEARKFARLLGDMVVEACEQKEKSE